MPQPYITHKVFNMASVSVGYGFLKSKSGAGIEKKKKSFLLRSLETNCSIAPELFNSDRKPGGALLLVSLTTMAMILPALTLSFQTPLHPYPPLSYPLSLSPRGVQSLY